CAAAPFGFGAVGAWYEHFELTGDSEVLQILARAHARQRPAIADAAASPDVEALAARCAMLAHPLDDAADLDPLLDRIGGARYVLLGEASHGTSDYYVWRARISQRLIREKGFSFIAVEGDWPNCYQVNRYVKGQLYGGGPDAILRTFTRWPTWMWANWEMTAFVDWLRRYNAGQRDERRVGF